MRTIRTIRTIRTTRTTRTTRTIRTIRTIPTKELNILSTIYKKLMLRRKYRGCGSGG